MLNSTIVANRRPLCNRDPPPPRRAKTRAEKTKKKDILSDVLLGALEEIRTPDLLIRSQTLYPTELPAQVQDIYYHRHRGLSTVFVKKFKIFFAKQKKVLLPPSGGGRRALFSAADSSPAPPCARGCPRAACGVPCTLRWPPCALRCPLRALRCPLCALGCPCAPWGVPVRPGVPRAPWDALCALECPCVACGAPCALCGAPVRPGVSPCALALPCGPPAALRRITPRNTERASPPPRGGPLPRPAAHGREKARPLQKERPGLVHFAVRR